MSMDQRPASPTTPSSRPRPRSRGVSFGSHKSGGSKSLESPKDKARRDSFWKGLSKANPNAAINEDQPGVKNLIEESTLQNLRDIRHIDAYGNPIADPDYSNPTRSRMERPLDTIRSFEKAIDDGYKRRSTYMRQDAEQWDQNNQYASRRSSYFGGYENGPNPNRYSQFSQGGYYGTQNGYSNGAQNGYSNGTQNGYSNGTQNGYSNGAPPSRMRYGSRMQSDPQMYSQQRPYPQHGHHQSHDTVNTGGSDSTGPWANSTDPSSENSSLERANGVNKPLPPVDAYGGYASNGYNGPIMEEQGPNAYGEYPQEKGYYNQQGGHMQRDGYGGAPPPNVYGPREIYRRHNTAPMENGGGRRPSIPLTGGNAPIPPAHLPSNRGEPEKRKSWFARRFSKNN